MSGCFSALNGCGREPLPWSWQEKVLDFLKPDDRLLELSPGDGAFLSSLRHPRALCTFLPQPEFPLPFGENSFDLVLDNGGEYDLPEVHRVLKSGGFFLTQQFGGGHMLSLRRLLSLGALKEPNFNLENELPKVQKAGFRVMYRNQAYPILRFSGAEAVLAHLSEEGAGFGPRLEAFFARHPFLETEEHRFLFIAKKR